MNLTEFLKNREERKSNEPVLREICRSCFQPGFSCFCAFVRPFAPNVEFVILTHPIEVKHRRIATGRMSHLILENSHWFMGHDYSEDEALNALLADPGRHCVILYPGARSVNLSHLSPEERFDLFPEGKLPTVIVIDGTWATARKMMRLSRNLHGLPRVGFTPTKPSDFRVRQQPSEECYSTIEAIHYTLELLGDGGREHDHLLYVFDRMVNRQLELAHSSDAIARPFKP